MVTRKLTKIIAAVLIIGLSSGYLLYEAASSSWVYYYSVDEFIKSQAASISPKNDSFKAARNPVIRIAGLVKSGSIVRNTEINQLDFELTGSKTNLAVRYNGPQPNNFAEDREVVVEGKAIKDKFVAEKILTRCESKYKVKLN